MAFKSVDDRRAYFRARYNGLRAEWFKKNGPCRHCGARDNLQVDHIDPRSKEHPDNETRLWNWSRERRERELAKCQVLCASCHWTKTAKERETLAVVQSQEIG